MKGGDIRTPPFYSTTTSPLLAPSSIQFKYFKNMKRIYLSLLLCLAYLLASAQEPLNGDSLPQTFGIW